MTQKTGFPENRRIRKHKLRYLARLYESSGGGYGPYVEWLINDQRNRNQRGPFVELPAMRNIVRDWMLGHQRLKKLYQQRQKDLKSLDNTRLQRWIKHNLSCTR